MKRVKTELVESGLADEVPKTGEKAPDFTLPNIYGDTINSAKLLTQGPLVLHFYRGGW
jgi:peroxiredoxin